MEDLLPALSKTEYEGLKEDIRIHGVRYPIIRDQHGSIIDGNHRQRICEELRIEAPRKVIKYEDEKDAILDSLALNIKRRNLSTDQLREIARRLKKEHACTQEQIAEIMGVGRSTISGWLGVTTNVEFDNGSKSYLDSRIKLTKEQKIDIEARIENGETQREIADDFKVSQQLVAKIAKVAKRRSEIEAEIERRAAEISAPELFNCDFREVNPSRKIDLVFTDPPYPSEFLPLWDDLGRWAKDNLKEHGYLLAYSGQLNLNLVMAALSRHLNYYWTFALIHTGNHQLISPRNIFCGWKPILIFQNGLRRLSEKTDDIVNGTGREKEDHEWQQAEDEIEPVIEAFSNEGDLICDPFMGSGTIPAKAYAMNRAIMGMEIDPGHFNTAKVKIYG